MFELKRKMQILDPDLVACRNKADHYIVYDDCMPVGYNYVIDCLEKNKKICYSFKNELDLKKFEKTLNEYFNLYQELENLK